MPSILIASESGDVATWVTGIATILLFAATLGLVLVGFKQIEIEREARAKREAADLEMHMRAQAELISAWFEGETVDRASGFWQWIAVANESTSLCIK